MKGVLCFFWQDNNGVLGLTTAYSLNRNKDKIKKNRRRPVITSTNARIIRPVFGDSPVKELYIPLKINAYNKYIHGVDIANQL